MENVDHLLTRLLDRADLFDDPAAYEAGVREALELVAAERDATPESPLVARSA